MVRAPQRITRKDLRRPDQFVTLTGRLLDLFRQHRAAFLVSLTLVIAVSLSLWGWDLYRGRQNRLAAQEYSRALTLFHNAKYREALEALAQVVGYRSSIYGRFGLLYQANSYIALKEPANAATVLQELLRREKKDALLRQLGLLTLGHVHERLGQCLDASRSFAEAEKIQGPFKEEALLGKARCSAQNRQLKEALSLYRQYLSNYPASERASEVALKIQELEAMIGAEAMAK